MNGNAAADTAAALSLSTLASTAEAYASPATSPTSSEPPLFAQTCMPSFTPPSTQLQLAQTGLVSTSDFLSAMQHRADMLMAAHKAMLTQPLQMPLGHRHYLANFALAIPQIPQPMDNNSFVVPQLGFAVYQPLNPVKHRVQSPTEVPAPIPSVGAQSVPSNAVDLLSALSNYSVSLAEAEQHLPSKIDSSSGVEAASPKTEEAQRHSKNGTESPHSSGTGKKRARSFRSSEDINCRVLTPQRIAELGAPFQKASIGKFDKDTPYKFPHDASVTLAAEFRYFLSEYMKSIDSAEEELMTRRFDCRDDAEEALHFTLTHLAPCLCSVMYGTLHRKGGTFYRYLCPTATKRKHTQPGARGCPTGRSSDAVTQENNPSDKLLNRPCSYTVNNPDALLKAVTSRSENECHWVAILAVCPDDPTKYYFKRIDSVSRHCALCVARRSSRVKRVIMKKIGELCSGVTDAPPTKKLNTVPHPSCSCSCSCSAVTPDTTDVKPPSITVGGAD